MSAETGDERRIPHPRETAELIGHEGAEAMLAAAHASGRLAHAWLITGPRGIGKATLAYRFARFVLGGGGEAGLFGATDPVVPDSLAIDPSDPVFRRVAAASHADLLTVERAPEAAEIAVADARSVSTFMHLTPAEGAWRVAVIDSADELNRHGANAILKMVEEPPARALILLVSHAPSRLLPTIRSRCRKLVLEPLSAAQVLALLDRHRPDLADGERQALARLADGSPGRALALAEAGGLDLYGEMAALLAALPSLDLVALHDFTDRLARRGAEAGYQVIAELLEWWLARLVHAGAGLPVEDVVAGEGAADLARRLAPPPTLDRWAALWENTGRLFRRADSARLDRKQVLLDAFLAVKSAAHA